MLFSVYTFIINSALSTLRQIHGATEVIESVARSGAGRSGDEIQFRFHFYSDDRESI